MSSFTDISKETARRPIPTHALEIAGEDWSRNLITSRTTYTTDAGGSGFECTVYGSLEDYADAPIKFWLGYEGNNVLYFKGTLQSPVDDSVLWTSQATAFGPFRLMQEQVLGTTETFIGRTLENVIIDCANRAGHASGEIMVVNGRQYHVQAGERFVFDNNMADVINTLLGKARFVGYDVIGGRRVYMPEPRPGSNTNFKTTYSPNEYVSFVTKPSKELAYYKVVVYRNDDKGNPVVYSERLVDNLGRIKPPVNRWFTVPDFIGNQQEAGEESYRLAVNLRNGEKDFTATIFYNPDIHLYDGFRAKQNRRISATQTRQVEYACTVDTSVSVTYEPGTPALMELSGHAYEIRKERKTVVEAARRVVTSDVLQRYVPTDNRIGDEFILLDDEILE